MTIGTKIEYYLLCSRRAIFPLSLRYTQHNLDSLTKYPEIQQQGDLLSFDFGGKTRLVYPLPYSYLQVEFNTKTGRPIFKHIKKILLAEVTPTMKHKAFLLDIKKLVDEAYRRHHKIIEPIKLNIDAGFMIFTPDTNRPGGYYYSEKKTLKYKVIYGGPKVVNR